MKSSKVLLQCGSMDYKKAELLAKHFRVLGETFAILHIFVAWTEQGATKWLEQGQGNVFARYEMMQMWLQDSLRENQDYVFNIQRSAESDSILAATHILADQFDEVQIFAALNGSSVSFTRFMGNIYACRGMVRHWLDIEDAKLNSEIHLDLLENFADDEDEDDSEDDDQKF